MYYAPLMLVIRCSTTTLSALLWCLVMFEYWAALVSVSVVVVGVSNEVQGPPVVVVVVMLVYIINFFLVVCVFAAVDAAVADNAPPAAPP